MYIRESRKTNKKNGEIYTRHHLVEAIRTDKGPRQRVVMPLGKLDLPKSEWKKLAHALECQLAGQETLLSAIDQDIETLALKLISNNQLSASLKAQTADVSEKNLVTIDAGSLATVKSRTLGAELACQRIWELLGFETVLKECGFDARERTLAKAIILSIIASQVVV